MLPSTHHGEKGDCQCHQPALYSTQNTETAKHSQFCGHVYNYLESHCQVIYKEMLRDRDEGREYSLSTAILLGTSLGTSLFAC